MEFKPEIIETLLKIDFTRRAKKLTEEHSFDRDNTFENYDNKQVIKLLGDIGYKAKYNRTENFFKVVEEIVPYKFYFHISLRYGIVELIWYVDKGSEFYGGSVWSVMKKVLENNEENLKDPCFHSYEELKEILKEAFSMYEDFKRELSNINL